MIRRRLPLPSSGTPFLSCFHLVTAFLKKYILKAFRHLGKKRTRTLGGAVFLRRGHSRNLWALRPKKKSGRNPSCGHGNSTGNRKSLTIRVQVGILRTLRLSCHKRYAQISITSQLYHKILWLSRKRRLTATRKSVLPGDIHTPEAAQNTAASGAGSRHAPTGLLQLLFFLFCVGHNCPSIIALSLSCITSYHELWLFVNGFSE